MGVCCCLMIHAMQHRADIIRINDIYVDIAYLVISIV